MRGDRALSGKRFRHLRLRNVRCFADQRIPLGRQVTVILGANGAGKTTLVESLASLTHGPDEGLQHFPLRHGEDEGEIALYDDREEPAASWKSTEEPSSRQSLPEDRFLLAYGRYRRVFDPQEQQEETFTDPASDLDELASTAGQRRTVTLNRPDNNLLRDLSRYLTALDFGRRSDPRLDSVWKRLNQSLVELEQGIEGIQMVESTYGHVPKLVRLGRQIELRELSDGYQAILVVIFDLVLRYAYLFPTHHDPLQGEAVVAIDEVDLHLHPSWQRVVTSQLIHLFPNTQFVLTTHSPAVVQGAIDMRKDLDDRKIVALHERRGEVRARPLGRVLMRRLRGSEIGAVLLDDYLFNVQSRYSPRYSAIEEQVDKLQERIERGEASEQDHQQLFKYLDKLHELMVHQRPPIRPGGSLQAQVALPQPGLRLEQLLSGLRRLQRHQEQQVAASGFVPASRPGRPAQPVRVQRGRKDAGCSGERPSCLDGQRLRHGEKVMAGSGTQDCDPKGAGRPSRLDRGTSI